MGGGIYSRNIIPSYTVVMYSVTQSKSTSPLGYVVLDSFDKVYRDEDSILDQTYQKQIFSDFNYEDLEF